MVYRVGGNVDAWCGRCKLMLAHTIEAIAATEIKRVHCNTCMAKHAYKGHEPGMKESRASAKSSTAKSSSGKSRVVSVKGLGGHVKASDYARLMQGRNLAMTRSYSLRETYASGEVLSHKLFGVGVVTLDKGFNKVEVLFEAGPKVLLHGK